MYPHQIIFEIILSVFTSKQYGKKFPDLGDWVSLGKTLFCLD